MKKLFMLAAVLLLASTPLFAQKLSFRTSKEKKPVITETHICTHTTAREYYDYLRILPAEVVSITQKEGEFPRLNYRYSDRRSVELSSFVDEKGVIPKEIQEKQSGQYVFIYHDCPGKDGHPSKTLIDIQKLKPEVKKRLKKKHTPSKRRNRF